MSLSFDIRLYLMFSSCHTACSALCCVDLTMAAFWMWIVCSGPTVVGGACLPLLLLLRLLHLTVLLSSQYCLSSSTVSSTKYALCKLNVFVVGIGELCVITVLILLLLHVIPAPNCHPCPIPCWVGKCFLFIPLLLTWWPAAIHWCAF